MSGFYESKIFPLILDIALRKLEPDRQQLINKLRGKVLEIGVGTGANLPYYHPDSEVIGIEPGSAMLTLAQRRIDRLQQQGTTAKISLQQASAEQLPYADGSFDQVLVFLVLCTIPNHRQALTEAVRVLKPGGEVHFFEHVRSPHDRLARWQDRVNPVWKKFACGCNLNRDTGNLLADHGLSVEMHRQGYLQQMGPRIASYVIQGVATKPG